jgi:NADH:ubiquinone oxidoreductase subunit C
MSETVEKLQSHLKSDLLEVRTPRERRIFARVGVDSFKEAARYTILDLGFDHLSTITGIDLGGEVEVVYHLVLKGATALSLSVRAPKDNPAIPTISDIMPNAAIYEREVNDLVGIRFEGLEDSSPLILPEGWPGEVHPLRKEMTFEELHSIKLRKG